MPVGKSKSKSKGSNTNGKAVKMQQPNRSQRTNAQNQGNSAPSATFKDRRVFFTVSAGSKPGSIRIRAQDYLGVTTWATTAVSGTTLLNILLCPGGTAFKNTRLGKFSELYDKYCFKNLKFHVQTATSTSQTGSYILAYDTDVSDPTPPANVDAIRQFLAHQGSRMGAAWESISIDCPLSDEQKFFYTSPSSSGDERLTYQGQIYLAVSTPISSQQSMNLWLEYEIELYDPQLESPVVESVISGDGVVSSTANAGWNTADVTNLANAIVPPIQDAVGNRGFSVPPGNWMIEQALQQSSAGGNSINSPTVFNLSGGPSNATLTSLNTAFQALTANANANGWRADKLINPGPDDVRVFGNLGTNAETAAQLLIKIWEQGGSSFI